MNATAALLELLLEWRRRTVCEHQAILQNDWHGILEHQEAKKALRTHLEPLLEPRRGSDWAQSEGESLKTLAFELMALEARNRDLLSAKCQSRRAELQCLSESARNLQGVRRAYGTAIRSRWQSYS